MHVTTISESQRTAVFLYYLAFCISSFLAMAHLLVAALVMLLSACMVSFLDL